MKRRERGSASIEATIALPIFVFMIMAILLLVNYCIVQTRVSYAIQTTAKEMSQYSYFYHVFGLDTLDAKLKQGKTQAVETFGCFQKLLADAEAEVAEIESNGTDYFNRVLSGEKSEDLNALYGQIEQASGHVSAVINDPVEFMKSMACLAGEEAWEGVKSNLLAAPIAKGLTRRHFGATQAEADAYLEALGVVGGFDGMNFNMSTMFEDGSEDIYVVVYYRLEIGSVLPFDFHINVWQQARTRAWLGGDCKP